MFLATCFKYRSRGRPTAFFPDIAPSRMFTTNSLRLTVRPTHEWRLFFKIFNSNLSSFIFFKNLIIPYSICPLMDHILSQLDAVQVHSTRHDTTMWPPYSICSHRQPVQQSHRQQSRYLLSTALFSHCLNPQPEETAKATIRHAVQTIPRRSLLSKCHTVSQYTCKWNFLCPHDISTAFSVPLFMKSTKEQNQHP